jgi:hypothetical protein
MKIKIRFFFYEKKVGPPGDRTQNLEHVRYLLNGEIDLTYLLIRSLVKVSK